MNMNFQMENMSVPRNSSEPVQMDWGRAMTMMSHMMNMSSSDMSWLGQVNWLPNVDPRYMEAIQNSINSLVATVNQANMDRYVGRKYGFCDYDVIKWNIFRVTVLLCGESTGHRWIPLTNGQ